MSSRSFYSSTQLFLDFLGKFHARKLLTHNPLNQQPVRAPPPNNNADENSGDANAVIILFVLVLACAVICSVGINFLIRCLRAVYSVPSVNSSTPVVKSSGIKKKVLKTFPVVKYSAHLKLPGLDTECVICLSEFATGQTVRILPKCNHGFHVGCIDRWLRSNSSCPKCRHCLIETCEKIMGCSQRVSSSSPGTSAPVPEILVSIRSLEPEGILCSYG